MWSSPLPVHIPGSTLTYLLKLCKGVPKLTQDLNLPPFVQRSVGNPERKRISQLTV